MGQLPLLELEGLLELDELLLPVGESRELLFHDAARRLMELVPRDIWGDGYSSANTACFFAYPHVHQMLSQGP